MLYAALCGETPTPRLGGLDLFGLFWFCFGLVCIGFGLLTYYTRLSAGGVGLGWAGLGWAGLGWAGLGWAGLGWAGLVWFGLVWLVLFGFSACCARYSDGRRPLPLIGIGRFSLAWYYCHARLLVKSMFLKNCFIWERLPCCLVQWIPWIQCVSYA
jgi:hypothetical protein